MRLKQIKMYCLKSAQINCIFFFCTNTLATIHKFYIEKNPLGKIYISNINTLYKTNASSYKRNMYRRKN